MVVWDWLGMAVICWGRWELRGEREAAALSAGVPYAALGGAWTRGWLLDWRGGAALLVSPRVWMVLLSVIWRAPPPAREARHLWCVCGAAG